MPTQGLTDTSPAARRIHVALLRRAGPERRLKAGLDFSRDAIALSRAALRRNRPGVPEADVLLEWVAIQYGAELADALRRRSDRTP